jgi:hypothetical protein
MPLQRRGHQSRMNANTQHALLGQPIRKQAGEPRNTNFGLNVIRHEFREDLWTSVRLELHAILVELGLQHGYLPDDAHATSWCVGLCGCDGDERFEKEGEEVGT